MVLCVLLSDISWSPRPLWQTSRTLKHIRSCYSGDKQLPQLQMKVWVKQKAQETWQFLSPSPASPSQPFYLFHWPSVPVSLLKEHTASLYAVFSCVAVACCTMLPFPTSDGLCLHLSLHKMDNEEDVYCILSPHGFPFVSPTLSGCVHPFSLRTWNANQWSTDLEDRSWGMISYEKALTSTTKHGSWAGRQKKKNDGKEKNKLPYQSLGEEVGNTYAHPWFLPGRPPRNHFLLSSRSNSEPHLLKWKCSWECLWKGRASCRWDESNPRATVLELLTVVFKNIKEYSCFEGGKITLNFVCKCFNGAYVIRVNYQEPVYINP